MDKKSEEEKMKQGTRGGAIWSENRMKKWLTGGFEKNGAQKNRVKLLSGKTGPHGRECIETKGEKPQSPGRWGKSSHGGP